MSVLGSMLIAALIAGLFYLNREKGAATSRALWIPIVWLSIIGSRPVTLWLNVHRDVTLETQYTESSPVDAVFFGMLILGAAIVLNRRWAQTRRLLKFNVPIVLYFVYCAASISWADDPGIAIKRWVKAFGEFLVMVVVLTDPEPLMAMKRLFSRMSFLLIPLSILFIYFIPSMGSSTDPFDHKTIYFGVCTWKNQLGVLSLICGIASLWQFLDAYEQRGEPGRIRRMVAHGFLCAASGLLIVKADAMTSFSCYGLASMVLVMIMSTRLARRPAAVLPLVAAATGIALFALFFDSSMLHSLGRNSTLTGRTEIWAAVLAQHTNPLIGTGFESFWLGSRMQSVWDLSQVGIEEAHNGYLEFYINLGWIGIAILGLLIVSGYRHALAQFRRSPRLGSVRIALFTAALIFNCTEAGFRMMTLIWAGFLLAIIAAPAEAPADRADERPLSMRQIAAPSNMKVLQ